MPDVQRSAIMKTEFRRNAVSGITGIQKELPNFVGDKKSSGAKYTAPVESDTDAYTHQIDEERYEQYDRRGISNKSAEHSDFTIDEIIDALNKLEGQNFEDGGKTNNIIRELIKEAERAAELKRAIDEANDHKALQQQWQAENELITQQGKERMEYIAQEAKKLKVCIEIAAKIRAGTASQQEKRYLLKNSPTMYALATMREDPKDKNKQNWDTVKRANTDEPQTAEEMLLHGSTS